MHAVAEWVRQAVADADDPGTAARNLADLLARAESDLTDATPAQP
ncbi:hypothetical protein OG896_33565 [Streptomyces sp. NBC_00669]|nr:hypothetical protein [Streptomyces sp. NBC_00669]